ncbi:MAG: hypothetical protein ACLUFM_01970 [Lachnospiraceae bacterium]
MRRESTRRDDRFNRSVRSPQQGARGFLHILSHFSALPRGEAKKRQKFLPFPEIFSPEADRDPSDGTAATVSGYHFQRQNQPTEKIIFLTPLTEQKNSGTEKKILKNSSYSQKNRFVKNL